VVPVTHKDVARLVKSTGKPAGAIVRFCPFSGMEYDAEAGLWIAFRSGRRAMVLRKTGAGKCVFQARGRACSVYAARPQTCRTFPYSVDFDDGAGAGAGGAVSEIRLNKVLDCGAAKCREIDVGALVADARKENREDREYHRLVKRWNNLESRGTAVEFLRFIGF
jgi:hypothetical protein